MLVGKEHMSACMLAGTEPGQAWRAAHFHLQGLLRVGRSQGLSAIIKQLLYRLLTVFLHPVS